MWTYSAVAIIHDVTKIVYFRLGSVKSKPAIANTGFRNQTACNYPNIAGNGDFIVKTTGRLYPREKWPVRVKFPEMNPPDRPKGSEIPRPGGALPGLFFIG
jgi:hypothetical protein